LEEVAAAEFHEFCGYVAVPVQLQRELGSFMGLEVAYLGSRSLAGSPNYLPAFAGRHDDSRQVVPSTISEDVRSFGCAQWLRPHADGCHPRSHPGKRFAEATAFRSLSLGQPAEDL
jgi:hypothetical protein